MKKIITLLIILTGITAMTAVAQKVKIKKGMVYVDDNEFLTTSREFGNITVSTLQEVPIARLKAYDYSKPNPARENTNDPGRFNYPATIKETYYVVTFLNTDLEFETDQSEKKLMLAFYKYHLLNEDNSFNEKNARKISSMLSMKISGNRPTIIYNQ